MKQITFQKYAPYVFILIGVISRLIPHPANVAPVMAIALFSGVYLNKKSTLFLTFLILILSDVVLGFYGPTMLTVYGSFLLIGLLGTVLKKRANVFTIAGATLFSSVVFFIATNLGVWYFTHMYSHDLAGLIRCYTLAIPFFKNTLAGDMFYSVLFFGGYQFVLSMNRKWTHDYQILRQFHFFS